MISKGLFWIWIGPLAWMAILLLVASGEAGGAIGGELAASPPQSGARLIVGLAPEPGRSARQPASERLCASVRSTRPNSSITSSITRTKKGMSGASARSRSGRRFLQVPNLQ
jgi:hypothetical protein